jgi:hypothetical protein
VIEAMAGIAQRQTQDEPAQDLKESGLAGFRGGAV